MIHKAIWKYVIKSTCEIEMPTGAEILSVHQQGREICLWALVNTEEPTTEMRSISAYGTGHSIPTVRPMKFIGTVLLANGDLVFHIFENL